MAVTLVERNLHFFKSQLLALSPSHRLEFLMIEAKDNVDILYALVEILLNTDNITLLSDYEKIKCLKLSRFLIQFKRKSRKNIPHNELIEFIKQNQLVMFEVVRFSLDRVISCYYEVVNIPGKSTHSLRIKSPYNDNYIFAKNVLRIVMDRKSRVKMKSAGEKIWDMLEDHFSCSICLAVIQKVNLLE